MGWREDVHLLKRRGETPAHVAHKAATMEAWLENRAYSTYPKQPWETRLPEMKWQAQLLRVQFSEYQIRIALYRR